MMSTLVEMGIGILGLIGYGWRRGSKRFISASPIATKGAALRGSPLYIRRIMVALCGEAITGIA
jgi:hypothetical protein